jgi:hypothetical protein
MCNIYGIWVGNKFFVQFPQNKKGHNTVFLRQIPNKLRNKSRDLFGICLKNTVL